MKNILVSDYDRTIYLDDKTTKDNITAINKFRLNNIFVLATGRSYEDFLLAQKKYGITADYYLLNYGAQILNHNMELVKKTPLTKDEISQIETFFTGKNVHIRYCGSLKNDDCKDKDIFKIIINYNDYNELLKDYNQFKELYNYHIFALKNHCSVEILSNNMNKATATKIIAEKENHNQIYVIGDSENDLDMIKEYCGYCVENAVEEVKQVSTKIYKNVSSLINELLEENK